MKKKKNDMKVKIFLASLTSLVMAGSVVGFSLIRSGKSESNDNTTSRSYEMSDDSSKSNYVEAHDEYEDVRLLEQLSGKSVVELNKLVKKYSAYTKCTPKEAAKILCDNYDYIVENYDDLKFGMIDTLFLKASEDGRLSGACDLDGVQVETRYKVYEQERAWNDPVVFELRKKQEAEQEPILLDFCEDMGMTADEKAICLAIFENETGHGGSEKCVLDNNYGGVKRSKTDPNDCVFQTPEFGMYMSLRCMYVTHIKPCEEKGFSGAEEIIQNIGAYNGVDPEAWSNLVTELYYQIKDKYPELKDAEKTFTKIR